MNVLQLLLAALCGTVAYFVIGFLCFAVLPLKDEFKRYPNVYRSEEGIMKVMPAGMFGIFVSIFMLALIYANLRLRHSGLIDGALFGAAIGLFAVGAFVLHNYVNLNIGMRITLQQSIMYLFEWVVVGVAIGWAYPVAVA